MHTYAIKTGQLVRYVLTGDEGLVADHENNSVEIEWVGDGPGFQWVWPDRIVHVADAGSARAAKAKEEMESN